MYQVCSSALERDVYSKYPGVSRCMPSINHQTNPIPGNYYSFANTSKMDARLFFTQGCVPTENDSTPPESVSRSIEGEQTPKPGRPAGARGRPKGKQKAGSKAAQS